MNSRLLFYLTAVTLLIAYLPSGYALGDSTYGASALTIEKIKEQDNGDIQIVFTSMAETMYHCPGANGKVTKKGVELTFVRAGYKKSPKVDYPAVPSGKDSLSKIITIPAKGLPVFLNDGKRLVKIHPK